MWLLHFCYNHISLHYLGSVQTKRGIIFSYFLRVYLPKVGKESRCTNTWWYDITFPYCNSNTPKKENRVLTVKYNHERNHSMEYVLPTSIIGTHNFVHWDFSKGCKTFENIGWGEVIVLPCDKTKTLIIFNHESW
jgi:hypothetical protein